MKISMQQLRRFIIKEVVTALETLAKEANVLSKKAMQTGTYEDHKAAFNAHRKASKVSEEEKKYRQSEFHDRQAMEHRTYAERAKKQK